MSEVYCRDCVHRRRSERINPFAGTRSWTPELLKAKEQWDHEGQELAYIEQDRLKSGEDFDFEPLYFDWCAMWTEKEGRKKVDPVTGEESRIYEMCARRNANRDCLYFCPR